MEWVIGIDEVGRGPLAGPVTVCALFTPVSMCSRLEGFNLDSKRLLPTVRQRISKHLHRMRREGLVNFKITSVSPFIIDRKGIVYAINLAIRDCLNALNCPATKCRILLDGGLRAPTKYQNQKTIVRGDATVPIIGLASVLAKVHRDRLMTNLGVRHPSWGFDRHKGYGTRAHYAALRKHGPSPIHRLTYL